jgi:hypothetical protein
MSPEQKGTYLSMAETIGQPVSSRHPEGDGERLKRPWPHHQGG